VALKITGESVTCFVQVARLTDNVLVQLKFAGFVSLLLMYMLLVRKKVRS